MRTMASTDVPSVDSSESLKGVMTVLGKRKRTSIKLVQKAILKGFEVQVSYSFENYLGDDCLLYQKYNFGLLFSACSVALLLSMLLDLGSLGIVLLILLACVGFIIILICLVCCFCCRRPIPQSIARYPGTSRSRRSSATTTSYTTPTPVQLVAPNALPVTPTYPQVPPPVYQGPPPPAGPPPSTYPVGAYPGGAYPVAQQYPMAPPYYNRPLPGDNTVNDILLPMMVMKMMGPRNNCNSSNSNFMFQSTSLNHVLHLQTHIQFIKS